MLSDTMIDAIIGIEHYQRVMPDIYDSNQHHIECVKRELVRLMWVYNAPPGTGFVFVRAINDTEPTTEKKAQHMVERHTAVMKVREKIADDIKAEAGLTEEDFKNPNPSPQLAEKIKIFYGDIYEKFAAWVQESEQPPKVKS